MEDQGPGHLAEQQLFQHNKTKTYGKLGCAGKLLNSWFATQFLLNYRLTQSKMGSPILYQFPLAE